MANPPINNSRSKASAFLLVAYLIFVILTAIVNYILPFSTYFLIFLGVAGIILLLNLLPKSKRISAGKGRAKTVIFIILFVLFLVILAFVSWGLALFGSPDQIYHVDGKSTVNLGSDFDFGVIEIDFAEAPKEGSEIKVFIGPYEAWTGISNCKYHQGQACYLGWWYYIDPPGANPIGVSGSEGVEIFYDEKSLYPMKIIKVGSVYGAIWIGGSSIIELDQSTSLTPKPMEGEKKISCNGCKIKEVKVYYNFFARLKNRLGWT